MTPLAINAQNNYVSIVMIISEHEIMIMWTNLKGRLGKPNGWMPDHFVSVGPVTIWFVFKI